MRSKADLLLFQSIACASQGITFATAYDSLGEEGLRHSINEPESTGVYTNANLLGTLASVVGQTPSLKFVVYDGKDSDIASGALETIRAANGGIEVLSFDDFIKSGKENPVEANPPQPDDVLAIMYTSGEFKSSGLEVSLRRSIRLICSSLRR